MTFHVVCHDCDFEDLWGTELEAEDDVRTDGGEDCNLALLRGF
jgi:hypothetical protein